MASLHHPRIIGSPAASRKNNQHYAVHEASRQPTQGHAADEPQPSRMTRQKHSCISVTFYTHAYITKTPSSGPASAETRDRRRINTMKMSCRRWVSRINGAAAGDMHHPMSQYTISPSRAVTVISPICQRTICEQEEHLTSGQGSLDPISRF